MHVCNLAGQFGDILGERSSDKTHMQYSNLAEMIKVIHTMNVKFGSNRVTYESSYSVLKCRYTDGGHFGVQRTKAWKFELHTLKNNQSLSPAIYLTFRY